MFTRKMKILAFILVSAMLLSVCMPVALAEEKITSASAPDLTAIAGSTGGKIGNANVYVDDKLAGKTDSKGNFTFTEAPAAGNHNVLVSAKGMNNVTLSTDFSQKPVIAKMTPTKGGKTMTLKVVDSKSKSAVEGVSVYNGNYLMGTTDASGSLVIKDVPMGLYLVKLNKEGYKNSTGVMIAVSNRSQTYSLATAA